MLFQNNTQKVTQRVELSQSRMAIISIVFTIMFITNTSFSFSQYLPVITNSRGDTIHYQWPIPDSLLCIKNEIIIKFKANALNLNKLCYTYQSPLATEELYNEYSLLYKNELMSQEFPVDTLIADSALRESIKHFGGVSLSRISTNNPCSDTLSITRYGDTVKCENYLYMVLKLNNDSLLMNACIWLTLFYQNYLEIAEPNYCRNVNNPDPTDPYYHGVVIDPPLRWEQSSLKSFYTDVRRAWDFQVGSKDIKVAVIDNGIDYYHCDFGSTYGTNEKVAGGYNYFGPNLNIVPDSEHGTNVAGIIGAYTNWSNLNNCPNFGIAGIAGGWGGPPNLGCTLYGLKTHNGNAKILDKHIISALLDASSDLVDGKEPANYAVHIINCSFGGELYSECMRSAINFAYEQGVSIICSRGNKGNTINNFPSTYDPNWVFSVGGHDEGDPTNDVKPLRWSNSSYGEAMDLLAPSINLTIITTRSNTTPSSWIRFGMTSAAAPHVSGGFALLRSEFHDNPNHTIPQGIKPEPEDYENMLKAAALDLNYDPDNQDDKLKTYVGYDNVSGWGQLKIGKIFDMLNDGYVIKHYKIEQLEPEDLFQEIEGGIAIKANGIRRDVPNGAYENAERRTITGTITIEDNWIIDETHNLYAWGRNGKTLKGGFGKSNPLYLTSFTEVTSGEGGNGLVEGIIHNNSLTINAKTYQYRLNQGIMLPTDENLELYITVFGKRDVTSVNGDFLSNTNFIFPNPAKETITLKLNILNYGNTVIRVYNSFGEKVLEELWNFVETGLNEKTINISNLYSGVYLLEIIQNTEVKRSKFIIAN